MAQFKLHEVIHIGNNARGQAELDRLLKEGWHIYNVDDSETWTYQDHGTVYCRAYKYKLRKE